jgi:hypothetical protein
MSTFLELVQDLHEEVRATGSGPSAVTNQTGEYKRLVSAIRRADRDIQRKHNEWKFMRASFTVNTVANTAAYSATDCSITKFRNWVINSFKMYLQSGGIAGEAPLHYVDYDTWYRRYGTGAQTASYPNEFTILHNDSFSLGPKPNAVYVVSGEYQKAVTLLAVDADEPAYPEEYHAAAVYLAMQNWGRSTGAPELYQDGERKYNQIMSQMERTQLPEIMLGAPLA